MQPHDAASERDRSGIAVSDLNSFADLHVPNCQTALHSTIVINGLTQYSWADLLQTCADLIPQLQNENCHTWALYCSDRFHFLCALLSLLHCQKKIILLPNNLPATRQALTPSCRLLDDETLHQLLNPSAGQTDSLRLQLDPRSSISFLSSGSSGQPRLFEKQLAQLDAEVAVHHALFDSDSSTWQHLATVSHQHIYGFLFACWWPLRCGHCIRGEQPQQAQALLQHAADIQQPLRIISSPAFWKRVARLDSNYGTRSAATRLFSSAGVLTPAVAEKISERFACPVCELYGSTETGGIGWRSDPKHAWQALPGVQISCDDDGRISVNSPFICGDSPYRGDDCISLSENGQFTLLGRMDAIVKLEDKRIALQHIEEALQADPWIDDAACLKLEKNRELIAAVLVLSTIGLEIVHQQGRLFLQDQLRTKLKQQVETIAMPRQWRYCTDLPRNQQGKIQRQDLQVLFEQTT